MPEMSLLTFKTLNRVQKRGNLIDRHGLLDANGLIVIEAQFQTSGEGSFTSPFR